MEILAIFRIFIAFVVLLRDEDFYENSVNTNRLEKMLTNNV